MDKSAIRNFAVWARINLIESVSQKAFEYGIEKNGEYQTGITTVAGKILSADEVRARNQLVNRIKEIGYTEVMEEVAYTWFNRFTALRFMEVNEYLPARVRLFSDENGDFNPDVLKEALTVELNDLNRQKVVEYLENQNNEELYKYLLITQCNALSSVLSPLFTKLEAYVELLIPNNLLRKDSVLYKMVKEIPEDNWKEQVEIIGWLYQYYISERHEQVVDPLHGKIIKKEDIPAATQLFTTEWVVKYIVDNSLGRYWIERNPQSALKGKLQYLAMPKDGDFAHINEQVLPEELTVLDPCVGSGHFLAYAFDVLMEIYKECGYTERDAAESILQNNLYGLDLDNRAVQLACFSLKMKARTYNRRILNKTVEELPQHVYCIEESNTLNEELFSYLGDKKQTALKLKWCFTDAKEYGSIIKVGVNVAELQALKQRLEQVMETHSNNLLALSDIALLYQGLMPLINQAEVLARKYVAVVTNPPYMNRFDAKLSKYVKDYYEDYKGDLFSVFIYRNFDFCKENGYSGLMTPYVWMFIKTYEKLREYIIKEKSIASIIQMEYSAYEEATVPICSFVLQNSIQKKKTVGIKLSDFKGGMAVQREKVLQALHSVKCNYIYEANQFDFLKIPSMPIAFWVGEKLLTTFENKKISDFGDANNGFTTGDNNLFLRFWYEVSDESICYTANSFEEAEESCKKWFPYNKGGAFRRWYGNNDFVLNWENDGAEIKAYGHLVPRSMKYQFRGAISWSKISSSVSSFKIKSTGTMFDVAGLSLFPFTDKDFNYLLGLCNSSYAQHCLDFLSPTLNYETGHIASIPVKKTMEHFDQINELVELNIAMSRADWDSSETSWDFKKHPLI